MDVRRKGERERFQAKECSERGMERGDKRRVDDEAEEEGMVGCSPDCSSPTPTSVDGESREEVMSEVHLGCPPRLFGPYISRFTFAYPPSPAIRIEGAPEQFGRSSYGLPNDQIRPFSLEGGQGNRQMTGRKHLMGLVKVHQRVNGFAWTMMVILFYHDQTSFSCRNSAIPASIQVWRAALVLADFVLHKSFTSSDCNDIVAVELGAGTDYDDKVLGNCVTNADLNSRIFKYHRASVCVRELNWKKSWPPTAISGKHHVESRTGYWDELLIKLLGNLLSRARYWWTPSEIEEAQGAPLILAADVIYSDDLTDAFFNTLEKLMSCGCEKVLCLALEKRYNFSLDDLDVVANGYLRFRSYLRDEEGGTPARERLPCFVGKLVDLTEIPQYMRKYERGNDLEIWQIKYAPLETST
ncbi:hypothetical protein ACLOJK_030970 [Asimina triloba]